MGCYCTSLQLLVHYKADLPAFFTLPLFIHGATKIVVYPALVEFSLAHDAVIAYLLHRFNGGGEEKGGGSFIWIKALFTF